MVLFFHSRMINTERLKIRVGNGYIFFGEKFARYVGRASHLYEYFCIKFLPRVSLFSSDTSD